MSDAPKKSHYIVGPLYDWAFFLLPPLVSLWLGMMISGTGFSDGTFELFGLETTAAGLCIGTIIHAHLVAVVFRSHLNREIFELHPWRFIAVPVFLWIAIVSSTWIAITATVVATFWDVWHSGAQTFGFGRIYDRNAGVPPDAGRRLDLWLNQLLYLGPILGGAALAEHIHSFDAYEDVGAAFFTAIPAQVEGHQRYITYGLLVAGSLFVLYYVLAHVQLWKRGHRSSPLKIFLTATTGLCSIYTWGFNTWGEAFFIMNLFHAVQYLALVWAVEHKRIAAVFRVSRVPGGKRIAAVLFLLSVFLYGAFAETLDPDIDTLWALTVVVSLMHFWYDGFVWSIRKRQI